MNSLKKKDIICNKIRDILLNENICVDVYLTGSYSTGELRTHNVNGCSDIDIVIVYYDKNDLRRAKHILVNYLKDNPDFSFCYCFYENFINSSLCNYYLSIDFEAPILKKLPFKYEDLKNETLDEKRWIYQLQATLYYFSKFMLTQNTIYLTKAYLNLIRMLIYRNCLVRNNAYINVLELDEYLEKLRLDNKLFNVNISSYLENKILTTKVIDENLIFIYRELYKLIYLSDTYDEINFLSSIKNFFLIVKEKGLFYLKDIDYNNIIDFVMIENTGNDNRDCVTF